jgi:hypothetical protein
MLVWEHPSLDQRPVFLLGLGKQHHRHFHGGCNLVFYILGCTNPVTISPVGHIPGAATPTLIGSHGSAIAAALKMPRVTPAPIYASVITVTSLNSTTSYSPLPTWTEVGGLLVDYCASPDFSLFHAAAAWLSPVPAAASLLSASAAARIPVSLARSSSNSRSS